MILCLARLTIYLSIPPKSESFLSLSNALWIPSYFRKQNNLLIKQARKPFEHKGSIFLYRYILFFFFCWLDIAMLVYHAMFISYIWKLLLERDRRSYFLFKHWSLQYDWYHGYLSPEASVRVPDLRLQSLPGC